jgi:hypothetical protein
MIAHGKSTPLAFKNMMVLSKDIVEADLNGKIKTVFQ